MERDHGARPQTEEKERDAILDWFGVAVRANEVADHVRRMALLARKVRTPALRVPPPSVVLHCNRS